jgi:hypothetical protein
VLAIKKTDVALQVVWGEVYAPDFPDSEGDFMRADTIRDMAWGFMRKGLTDRIDVQHSQQESGSYVVESFIARDGDATFIPGSWVIGVKVPDPVIWAQIEKGELNGFSLDGFGFRQKTTIELELPELPELLKGETDHVDGHKHGFSVHFSEQGAFLGGQTGIAHDGHFHKILRGTVTEEAQGHTHRFSFVEGVLHARAA